MRDHRAEKYDRAFRNALPVAVNVHFCFAIDQEDDFVGLVGMGVVTAQTLIEGSDVHFHPFEHRCGAIVVPPDAALSVFTECDRVSVDHKRSARCLPALDVRLSR